MSEFNKRKSITHLAKAALDPDFDPEHEDTVRYVSHFCFPFDYQFIAKNATSKYFFNPDSFSLGEIARPCMIFQVNSVDEYNC